MGYFNSMYGSGSQCLVARPISTPMKLEKRSMSNGCMLEMQIYEPIKGVNGA